MTYSTKPLQISIDGTDRTDNIPKQSISIRDEIDGVPECSFRILFADGFSLAENQEVIVSDPGDSERYFAGKIVNLTDESAGQNLHYDVTCRGYADDLNFSEADAVDGMYNLADSVGSYRLTNTTGVGLMDGKVGSYAAFFLNAESQYLTLADNDDISFGDEAMSGALWVRLNSKDANRSLLAKWTPPGDEREYELFYLQSTDGFRFRISSSGAVGDQVNVDADSLGSPDTDTWYFIHFYHDPTNNEIGISVNDGTVDTTATSAGIHDGAADLFLGTTGNVASYHDGGLDGVGLWSKVLSSAEVTSLYNAGAGKAYSALSAGEKTSLVVWYEFEPGSDAAILGDFGPQVASDFDWETNVSEVNATIDVAFDHNTPLDAVRKVAEQAGARWWVGYGPGTGGKTADVYYVDEHTGAADFNINVQSPDHSTTFPPIGGGLQIVNKRAPNRVIVYYGKGKKTIRTVGAEGDYGRWYTKTLERSDITNLADAQDAGDQWLARNGPNPTYKFSVNQPGLRAGQQITITDSRRSLSAESVVIQRVEHRFVGGGYWKTDVVAGRYLARSPIKALVDRLGGGGGGGGPASPGGGKSWHPPGGGGSGRPLNPVTDIDPTPYGPDNPVPVEDLTGVYWFKTVTTPDGTIAAEQAEDTLDMAESTAIDIVGDAGSDSVTIGFDGTLEGLSWPAGDAPNLDLTSPNSTIDITTPTASSIGFDVIASALPYATPALSFGTANTAGVADTVIRSDATLALFDATTPADVDSAGATGSAGVAARRDHVHRGVRGLRKAGESNLFDNVLVNEGANISITQASQTLTFAVTGLDTGDLSDLAYATPALSFGTPAAGSADTVIRSDATIAPPDIEEVGGIAITTPADDAVLAYDSASGNWIDQMLSASISGTTDDNTDTVSVAHRLHDHSVSGSTGGPSDTKSVASAGHTHVTNLSFVSVASVDHTHNYTGGTTAGPNDSGEQVAAFSDNATDGPGGGGTTSVPTHDHTHSGTSLSLGNPSQTVNVTDDPHDHGLSDLNATVSLSAS